MTAKPLEFGVAFHAGLEVYYDPETWDMPRDVIAELAIKKFVDVCEEQRAAYLKDGDGYIEADVQQDYNERVELGKGMFRYYFAECAPKVDTLFRPVKVEVKFEVPIINPITGEPALCRCDDCWAHHLEGQAGEINPAREDWVGEQIMFAGRLDMLAESLEYPGTYWIFDWKTAARMMNLNLDDSFLDLDDQIGSYVMALNIIGIPVRGFIYHEQLKNFPQPPKRNKVVRKGCAFSVSKSEPIEYDLYLKTIMAEDKQAYEDGCYDEILEWLKIEGPKYFQRHKVIKNQKQCEAMMLHMWQEAQEIYNPDTQVYPSPGRFGCNWCAFRQPCLGKDNGEDYTYTLNSLYERREHYYLRQEASTDTKGGE